MLSFALFWYGIYYRQSGIKVPKLISSVEDITEKLTITPVTPFQPFKVRAMVTRVIDGDTIEIEGGKRVRLIGVDSPEINESMGCYANEASLYLKNLIEGRVVELEKDISETDRYKRLLRYIYIDGILVNEVLVLNGFAKSLTYPPDVKYQTKFKDAEGVAREQENGLWGMCNN